MKCDNCGRTGQFGHNVSHSKRRTAHRWMVNVHPAKVEVSGKPVRLNVCTRCLRTFHKTSSQATQATTQPAS
jgi:large subunit ribosomal protein L28